MAELDRGRTVGAACHLSVVGEGPRAVLPADAETAVMGLDVPDAIEPVVGWRYWRVDDDRLGSLTRSTKWPAKHPFEAQCKLADRHGAVPSPACHCGVYAARDLPTLQTLARPNLRHPLVVGKVALWGRLIPAERGYRSQLAYPRRLWLVWESLETLNKHSGAMRVELADAYGVPVEFCDAEWALAGREDGPPDEERRPPALPGRGWDPVHAWIRLAAAVRRLLFGEATPTRR